jgi:hypothetical protein
MDAIALDTTIKTYLTDVRAKGGPSSSARRHQVSWSSKMAFSRKRIAVRRAIHIGEAQCPIDQTSSAPRSMIGTRPTGSGTPVEYRRDNGSIMRTGTRTGVEVLGGHTAIIWLEGVTGSIDLEWRPVQPRAIRIERVAQVFY